MAEHQIDYHIIPSDVFEYPNSYKMTVDKINNTLCINKQIYKALLIPNGTYISEYAAKGILLLKEANIPVIFIDSYPSNICFSNNLHSDTISVDDLKTYPMLSLTDLKNKCTHWNMEQIRCIPESSYVRCLQYSAMEYELFYIVNESDTTYNGSIQLNVSNKTDCIYQYDAWNNCCYQWEIDENNSFEAKLEASKGYLFIFDRNKNCKYELKSRIESFVTNFTYQLKSWKRSVCNAKDYPVFVDPKSVLLPDYLENEYPLFGGFVRYETEIWIEDLSVDPCILEIDGIEEGIELFINGISAGIQIVPTYRYEISNLLQVGLNYIVIEKATTLERVVPGKDINGNLISEFSNICGLTSNVTIKGNIKINFK